MSFDLFRYGDNISIRLKNALCSRRTNIIILTFVNLALICYRIEKKKTYFINNCAPAIVELRIISLFKVKLITLIYSL